MKSFLFGFTNGLGRILAKIIVFAVLGFLLLSFFNDNKEDIKNNATDDFRDIISGVIPYGYE